MDWAQFIFAVIFLFSFFLVTIVVLITPTFLSYGKGLGCCTHVCLATYLHLSIVIISMVTLTLLQTPTLQTYLATYCAS